MTLATEAEADAEYARNVGIANPGSAWILSDRDCWYRNPAYNGPAVPHPESDYDYEDFAQGENSIEAPEAGLLANLPHDDDIWGNDLPF